MWFSCNTDAFRPIIDCEIEFLPPMHDDLDVTHSAMKVFESNAFPELKSERMSKYKSLVWWPQASE